VENTEKSVYYIHKNSRQLTKNT